MKCPDKTKLEQYVAGKLGQEMMIELDKHVHSCPECKNVVRGIMGAKLGMDLGASLLGLDCPEYEELSAFVGEQLSSEKAAFIASHINSCEPCFNDVQRIRELRAHATLREKIVVNPRTNRRPAYGWGVWKRAFAGALGAAVIAGLAIGIGLFTGPKEKPTVVAVKPPVTTVKPTPEKPNNVVKPIKSEPVIVAVKPEQPNTAAVLKDGKYQVIKQDGRLILADASGARTSLEAKIAASIREKLATGSIKQSKTVQMAMLPAHLRNPEGYKAPANAPSLIAPLDKVILSVQPQMKWSKVDLAESYRVRIYDIQGRLVMEKTTANYTLIAGALPRGNQYLWRVGVRFNESDDWVESAKGSFYVLSAEDYASIQNAKKNAPGSHLALGAAYESYGLYNEAQQEYRALRRDNRDSSLARKLLYGTKKAE